MTGYLWLCEKCDGTGSVGGMWEGRYVLETTYHGVGKTSFTRHENSFPVNVLERCPDCKGRGYWEAT